jgi:uncharacterized protein YcfJ
MKHARRWALLVAMLMLAGCVTVPAGPTVTSLPGYRKSMSQFVVDDDACRQYAQSVLGPEAGQAGSNAAAANAVAATAFGAAIGAIIGSASGNAGPGAAIGAGTGLLAGSAAGSNVAGYSSYALQRTYDSAYMQCMYAHGNQVPGRPAYRGPPTSYPPVPYPPPDYRPPAADPPSDPAGVTPYRVPRNPPAGGYGPPSTVPPPTGFPPPGTPPPAS